jgi:hypothetical protein
LKFIKLGPVFAALVLAACQSAPPPAAVATAPPPAPGPIRGIDVPTDASDVLGQIKAARLNFVARYYRDPTSRWPPLSPREVQHLSTLDTDIVAVWEWHSRDPAYFSYASGYNDALSAYRQAKSVAQPPGSAIYFAVDFNARGQDLYGIDQYFRGIAAGLAKAGNGRPEYKVGVYGSGAVCAMIKGQRLARYAWLSGATAWEGSSGYMAWNIKQAPLGMRFPSLSFNHDVNEARDDFGGFRFAKIRDAVPTVATAAPEPVAPAAPEPAAPQAPPPDSSLVGVIRSWF